MQSNAPRPTVPNQSLLQGKLYQRGADVQTTWKRFGWTPPSEQPNPVRDELLQGQAR